METKRGYAPHRIGEPLLLLFALNAIRPDKDDVSVHISPATPSLTSFELIAMQSAGNSEADKVKEQSSFARVPKYSVH